jgi:hypothetical protein
MQRFQTFVDEHFSNYIGNDPRKHQDAEELHKLVSKAYEPIGGIHGSGFNSPHDMIKNIPMWKVKKKQGKIIAAALYKDKGGRKKVAVASDGTDEGKKHLASIVKDDAIRNRSYSEISGKSLSFLKKHVPAGTVGSIALPHHEVKRVMPDDEIRPAPQNDPEIVRHPELKKHFYQRKIGNEWHTKIAIGKTGNTIK